MSTIDDRELPKNLEAERAVLGAILIDNARYDAAAEVLGPEDFFRDAHRRIFAQMGLLAEQRSAIDLVTLSEALTRVGDLNAVGGPAYIAALLDGVPRSTNVAHYAQVVKEKATLRTLIGSANHILAQAYAAEEAAAVQIEQAQQAIFGLASERAPGEFTPIGEVVKGEVYPQLETWAATRQLVTGIPSGLIDLDYYTSGFQPSDLIIVAARPSVGKSALMMDIADHAAVVAGKTVGVFSLEMSKKQLALRRVAASSGIDTKQMRAGRLTEAQWAQMNQALERVANSRIYLDDRPALTVHQIRNAARKLKATVGLDLVMVDYLQLMEAAHSRSSSNRTEDVSTMSRGLKALAKELAVPVIALSQLSRKCEERQDKRPMLSDLRESGAIEQDADVVILIYRADVYDETKDPGTAELILAKQRNEATGSVRVGFDRAHTRFYNLVAA